MSSYARIVAEDMRLVVLQLLAQAEGFDLNDRILASALTAFGHRPSLDRLATELAWLAEQGLIETRDVEGFTVAALLARGQDVVEGRTAAPGVRRPRPDEL